MDETDKTPREADSQEPEIYALTRDAGGYKLCRRDFLAASAAAAAMAVIGGNSMIASGQTGGAPKGTGEPLGGKAVVSESTKAFHAHTGPIDCLCLSADGKFLASTGEDKIVRIWQLPDGALLRKGSQHTDRVRTAAFSPDGKTLASAGDDLSIRIWNSEQLKPVHELTGHTLPVTGLAFVDDDQLVSTSCDQTIRFWSLKSSSSKRRVETTSVLTALALCKDKGSIAAACDDKAVRCWSSADGAEGLVLRGFAAQACCVSFSPDGSLIAGGAKDGSVRVWSFPKGEDVKKLDADKDVARAVAFSPDGKFLAAGGSEGLVRIWSVSDWKLDEKLEGLGAKVRAVVFSADGKWVLAGSEGGQIMIWQRGNRDNKWLLFDSSLVKDPFDAKMCQENSKTTFRTTTQLVCTCDLVCTCNLIWVPSGAAVSSSVTCVCNTITVRSALPSDADGESKTTRVVTGAACSCDTVCTCDKVCTCNTISRPVSSHYWYPN